MKILISEERVPIGKGGLGLLLDDVNYAFDGGLSAELLENRNFEAKCVKREGSLITVSRGGLHAWEPYPAPSAVALKLKTDRPIHAENPHYVRVDAAEDGAGMRNLSYGGIRLVRGTEYKFAFSVRSYDYKNAVFAGVYAGDDPLLEKKVKIRADGKWHRFAFRLKCKADAAGAEFRFTLKKAGMVHASDFSLLPADAIMGVFRRDLVERVKQFRPAFVAFPAGRVAENEAGRYEWKDSVGDPDRRQAHWNIWAAHAERFAYYGQTHFVGAFECFRLAEYLGAQPLPVVALGEGAEDAELCVQNAADLVEFANGGADTMWGKLRIELGHAAPFRVSALSAAYRADLGEEEREKRFSRFEEKFSARCQGIEIFPPAAPLCAEGAPCDAPFVTFSCFGDVSDDPARNAWRYALREAVFLTRTESEPVLKAAETLFARIGYTQSAPALVWFDAETAFGSASYYVQRLFSLCTGDVALRAEAEEGVYASASERDGTTFVKVVNTTDAAVEAEIAAEHDFGALTRFVCMTAEEDALNTLDCPDAVVPREIAPSAPRTATLPPRSFGVLVFRK